MAKSKALLVKVIKAPNLDKLDKADISKLNTLSVYVNKEIGSTAESVIKIGEHLREAQTILAGKGSEGQFKPWLIANFALSIQSAYNYIATFTAFGGGKCKTVLHLLDTTAMHKLASDSTPEEATEEAIKRAGKGEKITAAVAKEIIAKHTEPAAEEPEPEAEEPEAEPEIEEEPTFEESVEAENKLIESFCRALVKFYEDNVPAVTWTEDSGRITSGLANVRASCGILRAAKAVVCEACTEGTNKNGKCRYCKGHGYLPTGQARTILDEAKI